MLNDDRHSPLGSSTESSTSAHAVLGQTFEIVLLPGDGIGSEVMTEALRILHAVEPQMPSIRLDLREFAAGAGEYQRCGQSLPPAALDACRSANAILFGAMGLPNVRLPDGREVAP